MVFKDFEEGEWKLPCIYVTCICDGTVMNIYIPLEPRHICHLPYIRIYIGRVSSFNDAARTHHTIMCTYSHQVRLKGFVSPFTYIYTHI